MMRFSSLKELFSLGSQFTVLQLSGQLSVNADPFILTACLGPASVALYRPPSQVVGTGSSFVLTLANQLHPLATKAHVDGHKKDLAAILFRGTKYMMLVGAVFCAVVISLAYPLCKVWLGKVLGAQYTVPAAVLTVQAITQLGAFAAGTQWPVLLGMKRIQFAAYGRLVLAVVNILTSWLLVRYSSLGVLGVAIPTMVIELIWRPVQAKYVCRAIGVTMQEYVQESYFRPLLIGGAVGAMGFVVQWVTPLAGMWSLAATAAALGLAGAALIWITGFSPRERENMRDITRSLVVKVCA